MWVAEIFPENSRLKNDNPICYFYKENRIKEEEDYDVTKRFELLWTEELVNSTAPNTAFVTPTGQLITLDEHMFLGSAHSIVIYDTSGILMKDYNLFDIIPEEEVFDNIVISTSSIWWRSKARYFFTNPTPEAGEHSWWYPTHFYIVLKYGKAIEIKLEDGTFFYDDLSKFQLVDSLYHEKFVNDEKWIREVSLENSSITELLMCLNK